MRVGVFLPGTRPRRIHEILHTLTLSALLGLVWAIPGSGQIPPGAAQPPDTVETPDGAPEPTPADSTAAGALSQDSVSVDTIFYNLPALESGVPLGFASGVWEWEGDDIMASGANTLAELVAEVPGIVVLLGGDYGTPAALSAFGVGGGGLRVVRDGFEVLPLAGGVTDLQRVGLVGVTGVRLERRGSELLLELTTYEYEDGRPFSLVQAGTGQFDTNVFRGTYADPTALAGSLALGLERVDTRGFGENEGGNRTGTWLRYQLHRGDRAGLAFDYRRMGTETQVTEYAASARRTDLTVRGRIRLLDGLVLEAFTGRSSYDVDDERAEYEFVGGTRTQHGFRLAARSRDLWLRASAGLYRGGDLPSDRLDAEGGYSGRLSGGWGRATRSSWDGSGVSSFGVGGWVGPFEGVTVFGSLEDGAYASRSGPVADGLPAETLPAGVATPSSSRSFWEADRRLARLGASVSRYGVQVAGAALRADSDVQLPLATELDLGSPVVAGAERSGLEAWGSLPTPWRSLRLEGSYQRWDVPGPYLPKEIYQAGFVFHRVYLDSENFELWWSVGVRGHDPMEVFVAELDEGFGGGLETVPFFQSWYGRIQARIVSVRLFLLWDNMSRRRNLQSFPGRVLPVARSVFGLHWDLWN